MQVSLQLELNLQFERRKIIQFTPQPIDESRVTCGTKTGELGTRERLRTLATQPSGKSKIFGLDGNTLGVYRGKVGILEERDKVSLSSLLQNHSS